MRSGPDRDEELSDEALVQQQRFDTLQGTSHFGDDKEAIAARLRETVDPATHYRENPYDR